MDAPPAVLHWDRGALEIECDRAAIVRAGVEAYLGRSVFADDAELAVRVSLSRVEGQGVVADVSQEDASGRVWGHRTVSGDASCASLDEPLTLVVALMVDSPARPELASEPTPSNAPAPPAPVPRSPEPARDQPEEIETAPSLEHATTPGHAALLGFGLASLGALPTTAAGGGLFGTVKPRGFWGIGAQLELLAPQQKQLGTGSLQTGLLLLGAALCPLQGLDGAWWWSACGTLSGARLKVESRGLFDSNSTVEWLVVPGFSVRAGRRVWRGLLLGGGLEAGFPVSPDRYVYRDPQGAQQVAFEGNQFMIAASLGVGVLAD